MQLPSVIHPKRFEINGMFFEIVTYIPITDDQAEKIAMAFFACRKFKKNDRGKLFQVPIMDLTLFP